MSASVFLFIDSWTVPLPLWQKALAHPLTKSPPLPWAEGLSLVSIQLPNAVLPGPAVAPSVLKDAQRVAGHRAPEKGDGLSGALQGCN